jgi:hypothetical protein
MRCTIGASNRRGNGPAGCWVHGYQFAALDEQCAVRALSSDVGKYLTWHAVTVNFPQRARSADELAPLGGRP